MTTPCCTLWIGPTLGRIERACLRSAMRQGHEVVLYCYQPPQGVPAGVTVRDAREVVDETRIVAHAGGSFALFSNLFRYLLLQRGAGTWIDCDVYLLKPLPDDPWLMGFEEDGGRIGTALLRIPRNAPLLPPLIELFDERTIPDWIGRRAKAAAWWRRLRRGRTGLAHMPWGVAGPLGLTALARRQGLERLALPCDFFFPVPWQQAGWIADPDRRLEQMVTSRTIAIHLCNELIKPFKETPAPAGTFLERLQEEGS